ncbi:MAG: hypothetical protein AAFS07_10920 [Pseudomonadota bacterium]
MRAEEGDIGTMLQGMRERHLAAFPARARQFRARATSGNTLVQGAGAHIFPKETALIESLERNNSTPRLKPPFPAGVVLDDCSRGVTVQADARVQEGGA